MLRYDDTDVERSTREFAARIAADLAGSASSPTGSSISRERFAAMPPPPKS